MQKSKEMDTNYNSDSSIKEFSNLDRNNISPMNLTNNLKRIENYKEMDTSDDSGSSIKKLFNL